MKVISLGNGSFLYVWIYFTNGSSKLKSKGVHWAAKAVQLQHQVCKIENGHDYSVQWAEVKAVLTPPSNNPPNKPCYIFTKCRLS